MPAVDLVLFVASVFPRVDDPWPNTIGIEFPFAAEGAGSILANVFCSEAPDSERDKAVARGGLLGFRFGAAFYVLALLNQIVSGA